MIDSPKLTDRQQQILDLVQSAIERTGAPPTRAEIAAEFDVAAGGALEAWLRANDLDTGESLLLRRVVDAGGRSRADLNGLPATVAQLREAADFLADIAGVVAPMIDASRAAAVAQHDEQNVAIRNGFVGIHQRIDELDERLDKGADRLAGHDVRLAVIEARDPSTRSRKDDHS